MSKEYKFNEKIIHALSNMSIKFDELGFTPTTLNDENYEYFVDWFHDEVKTIREESSKQEKNISDLEAKLAESETELNRYRSMKNREQLVKENESLKDTIAVVLSQKSEWIKSCDKLKQQLAQHEKHNAWVLEFLEKYQINTELTPEYSENPIIEYCEQVKDFRAVDNKIIEDLQNELAESEKQIKTRIATYEKQHIEQIDEIYKLKQQLAEKDVDLSLARNEIDTLKHNLNISQEHDNVMCEQYFEKCKQHNQDKISFCIEKLVNVQKYISDNTVYIEEERFGREINDFIDYQIKQLKEEK